MNTINSSFCSEITIKGSRFLAFLIPFDIFDETLKQLRATHIKAVHFVYAYRTLVSHQINERFSDDGEPKGSSGVPVLNVLRGKNLINIAAIVVRYFGGTLLGVGGLVRAYTQSVLEGIAKIEAEAGFLAYEPCKDVLIECEYSLIGRLEYLAKTLQITLQKEAFLEKIVKIRACGSCAKIDEFLKDFEQNLKFRS